MELSYIPLVAAGLGLLSCGQSDRFVSWCWNNLGQSVGKFIS